LAKEESMGKEKEIAVLSEEEIEHVAGGYTSSSVVTAVGIAVLPNFYHFKYRPITLMYGINPRYYLQNNYN
jgi:hypothetical protein